MKEHAFCYLYLVLITPKNIIFTQLQLLPNTLQAEAVALAVSRLHIEYTPKILEVRRITNICICTSVRNHMCEYFTI